MGMQNQTSDLAIGPDENDVVDLLPTSLHRFNPKAMRLCIHNCLTHPELTTDLLHEIVAWCKSHQWMLGIELPAYLWDPDAALNNAETGGPNGIRKTLRTALEQAMAQPQSTDIIEMAPDNAAANCAMLGVDMGASGEEIDLLTLTVHCRAWPSLERLASRLLTQCESVSQTVALLLGIPQQQAHRMLLPKSLLGEAGLVCLSLTNRNICQALLMPPRPWHVLMRPYRDINELRADLIGIRSEPGLDWCDFAHLGEDGRLARDLLRGALSGSHGGVNILLYGPPGTGKTEFAKVLAREAGATLLSIGEADEHGEEPERHERVAELALAQSLLHASANSVLLFDEFEDLIDGRLGSGPGAKENRSGSSLVFIHRMLEENPVPVIWTANNIETLRPSILRRFSLAQEMGVPPRKVRANIWSRHLDEAGLELDADMAQRLAREFICAPAIAASAVASARIAGGGEASIRNAVSGLIKAMRGGQPLPPRRRDEIPFRVDLINADMDLAPLMRVPDVGQPAVPVSLCLYGPPGTGKTALVHHMADAMGLEVLQKRASDLLAPYVGQNEQNIAEAFAEAQAGGQFLLFDEVDSLLGARGNAERSWQVSQINEMLTWMEVHDLPFACTTNLMEHLDPAALRRFTFKIAVDYLTPAQVGRAFRHYFRCDPTSERALSRLSCLTPGDFQVVRHKASALGDLKSADRLLALLEQECGLKQQPNPIGFRCNEV